MGERGEGENRGIVEEKGGGEEERMRGSWGRRE